MLTFDFTDPFPDQGRVLLCQTGSNPDPNPIPIKNGRFRRHAPPRGRSLATTGGWPTSNRNGRDQIGINRRPSEYEDALPVQREADTSGPGMGTEKTNGDPAPPAITSFSPARNRTSSRQK